MQTGRPAVNAKGVPRVEPLRLDNVCAGQLVERVHVSATQTKPFAHDGCMSEVCARHSTQGALRNLLRETRYLHGNALMKLCAAALLRP